MGVNKLNAVYERLRKEGVCVWCKRNPALPGRLVCENCLEDRQVRLYHMVKKRGKVESPLEMTPETLAQDLKRIREEAGITKAEAGRRSTISSCVIGQYERGDTIPGVYNLAHLLKAYGWRLVAVREEP